MSEIKNIVESWRGYVNEQEEEVISEQDTPEAIEKAVESDAGLEELLAAMAERMGELENEIQRLKSEYSNASARMGRITGEQE
jgi:archaellum component FlaC|tara:strand:- start:529 stop:777 length:249 start_codon:yes stop_codon:yes gene_type:complete